MTNRDKINNMSNEEFADFIYYMDNICEICVGCSGSDCKSGIIEWLESEIEMKEIEDFLKWFFNKKIYGIDKANKCLVIEKNNRWVDALEEYKYINRKEI